MRCPFCTSEDSQVKDSRHTDDGSAIRRRRLCSSCGSRFTTFERIQLRELTVIKKNQNRAPFDREKLVRSTNIALQKRPVSPEQIDRMISAIVRRLESTGDAEVSTDLIGQMVMESLLSLDHVAYVRYASVYRDFNNVKDFAQFIDKEKLASENGKIDGDETS